MSLSDRVRQFTAIAVIAATATACASTAAAPSPSASADAGTFAKDSNTLVFGAVPDQEQAENLNGPLADYIRIVTGKTVEYYQAADYSALIEATIAHKVDIAFLSGFTYFVATKNGADVTPFSAAITQAGAEPGYDSVAIANPDSGVTKLEDYKGKSICFVSETSTSGYLFPSSLLLGVNIDPAKDITPIFAGKHDASAEKVGQGTECAAGFAEDAVSDPAIAAGKVKEITRVTVPGAPIVFQNALPQSIKDVLKSKVTTVTAAEMAEAGAKDADQDWFVAWMYALAPVDDSYYDTIRDLCQRVTTAEACK